MTVAVEPTKTKTRKPRKPAGNWWGRGPAPWERWPGTTSRLEAVWSSERKRWESKDGRYWYDADAANRAAEFFPTFLEHHKGEFAGVPFTLLPYQEWLIVRPLFGWKRKDGLRRFRKVFLAIPKGNGKTPLGAGVGLYLTFCDGEAGAEVYSAAADREQAAIAFDTARYMVETNPDLAERAHVLRRAIEVPSTHSYYRVLSADVKSKHGPNIHGLIFDEFHAQPDRDLYEALYRGTVKRRQPVIFMITTAGDDDESICAEEWEYARRVMDEPSLDETYLPVIFEAGKDEDWRDMAVVRRVNPGLGITVKEDALVAELAAAQMEPRKRNDVLRYHLNRWVNQATAWIPVERWDAAPRRLPEDALRELTVFAGLDMAQKNDLAAFVLTFISPLEETLEVVAVGEGEAGVVRERKVSLNFAVDLVPFFWIPEETMHEHEKRDRVPYRLWAEQGLVTATEGNIIDIDRIYRDITGPIAARFPRLLGSQIGYDPAFATDLALRLQNAGITMVEVLQNYRNLSEPSYVFEAFLSGGRIRHDGHRVLRWNVENVAIRADDARRIRPVKGKRQSKRIDGVVAALMGLSRAIVNPVFADDGIGVSVL